LFFLQKTESIDNEDPEESIEVIQRINKEISGKFVTPKKDIR